MPKTRATRTSNPVPPFQRIIEVRGLEWIQEKFNEEKNKSTRQENYVNLDQLTSITSSQLMKIDSQSLVAPSFTCFIKEDATNKTGYPTIKVRLTSRDIEKLQEKYPDQNQFNQESVPLDLHRLAALETYKWKYEVQELQAIHRCHNKQCFNPEHLYFGTVDQNRSTDFCQAFMIVNNVLIQCCNHNPPCLRPGKRSKF